MECLALLWAVEKPKPYIEGLPFTVGTDHNSVVWLQNLTESTGRLAPWAVCLQKFDFLLAHRKGKEHLVPDVLSRAPILVDVITDLVDADNFTQV